MRFWTDVASSRKPALFQYERDDIYTNGKNYLQIVEMGADLYIHIDAGKDQSIAPVTTVLNPLLDLDAAPVPGKMGWPRVALQVKTLATV